MKLIETRNIDIADIDLTGRLRRVNPDWVMAMAEAIRTSGLQNPILVAQDGVRLKLMAGAHRVAACLHLGLTQIEARIMQAETARPDLEMREQEIVENVMRHELTAFDRACHLAELKRIHLEMHPEAGRGGNRKGLKDNDNIKLQTLQFDQEAAQRIGLAPRSIFLSVAIYEGLSEASRGQIAGTWLADNQAQLQALSKLDEAQQARVLGLLLDDQSKAGSVKDAQAILEKLPQPNRDEVLLGRMKALYLEANARVQRQFVIFLKDCGVRIDEAGARLYSDIIDDEPAF